ncbi:MAG: methyltransferase type 11 [Kangiellaceae bacterium]|jgi:ubiquinone/menaquinone biosynthesis C-methylase UbiE|nr:methyltransferase type 11 [Kangiellaceae bacterium]|tara:strand:+ start:1053 stop:2003 length:951 start_codon:yes stop_codon:yes gene_type:complete
MDLTQILHLICSPRTKQPLKIESGSLVTGNDGDHEERYPISPSGIPLFAQQPESASSQEQQKHYDKIAKTYIANLGYPHTQEYSRYLDNCLSQELQSEGLGVMAELCCGTGEAITLFQGKFDLAIGIDISINMLETAKSNLERNTHAFMQGDATELPIRSNTVDSVVMLGGIHHVPDRKRLFSEIHRILKPGGRFYYREPVSDFIVWRLIRAVIYRLSPMLEHDSERPLLFKETVPVLEEVGLKSRVWKTYGFFGFCLLMNSDVLVFNRFFRYIPGIRKITRLFIAIDHFITNIPGLRKAGLQVIGVAQKPLKSSS